jgi:hypothetical protein
MERLATSGNHTIGGRPARRCSPDERFRHAGMGSRRPMERSGVGSAASARNLKPRPLYAAGASSCRVSQGGWEGRDTDAYVGREWSKASHLCQLAPGTWSNFLGARRRPVKGSLLRQKKTPPERGKSGMTSSEGPVEPVPVPDNSNPSLWFRARSIFLRTCPAVALGGRNARIAGNGARHGRTGSVEVPHACIWLNLNLFGNAQHRMRFRAAGLAQR